jgi:hypothetical protein
MGGWLNTWLLLLTVGAQMEFSYFIIMQVRLGLLANFGVLCCHVCHPVTFHSSHFLSPPQVQPEHYWGFLGCFYVIGLFLVLTFARGMLLWDDWGCGAIPLDDQQQAAALMPELTHPNPDRRLRASQLRGSS